MNVLSCEMRSGQGTCPVCGNTYSNVRNLKQHMRNDHAASARCECPHPGCVETFERVVEVKKHLKSAHHEHGEGCRCCLVDVSATVRSAREMVLVKFAKATRELHCDENSCDFTTKCIRDMDLHTAHNHGHEVTLVCLFCSPQRQWFGKRQYLHDHLERIHNGKRDYLCGCGYMSAKAFTHLRHRAACEKGKGFGNLKTKQVHPDLMTKKIAHAFQHVKEQIELNITGESVFARYSFSQRILAEG